MTNYLIFLVFLFSRCYCQLTPLSVELSDISHITAGGGKVFASDSTSVYRYSSTANGLQQQQTHPIGQNIIGLAVTPDGEGLVICLDNQVCSVRNGSDLASILPPASQPGVVSTGSDDPIALFTASVPNGQSFYVGSYGSTDGDVGDRPRFGQYEFLGSSSSRSSAAAVAQSLNFVRQYFNGFTYSNYAYFIVLDRDNPTREVRIIRVCNDTSDESIQSQIELRLQCGSGVLNGATFIRGVSVFNEDILAIAVFNTGSNPLNRLCLFNISEINNLMDGVYDTCVVSGQGDRNVLWDASGTSCTIGFNPSHTICNFAATGPTLPSGIAPSDALSSSIILSNTTVLNGLGASIALTLDDIDLIFIGYATTNNEYYLNKYHWFNDTLSLIEEISITPSITIGNAEGLSIVASVDQQTLYLTTNDEIVSVSVENCSSASSCGECVSLGDPLCGWCVFEDKCSRSSQCMNSESIGRYLTQGEENSCLQRVDIVPARFVKDLQSEPFQVSVTFVPSLTNSKLPKEEFYCSFNNSMISFVSILNNGVCSVGNILNQLSVISLETQFSIFSNVTGVHFFNSESPYLFYDCVPQQMCSGCVEGTGVCGWCQLNFTCTGDNTTCTGGHNNWITTTSGESPSDVCPLLVAANDGMTDYTQPLNVQDNLSLRTLNTPDIQDLSYQCVFGDKVRTATRISDTSIECVIGQELTSTMNTETVDFTLRQLYDGSSYNLETNGSVDINVVLYSCPSLANSCSQCLGQNVNTGFSCGWCNDGNVGQCNVDSQCNSLITTPSGCGSPTITGINPTSGSPRGQTTITIDGTNLGVVFSDIVSVSVGSRSCNSIEDQYRSGVRIVCTISTSGSNTVGTATITVTINNGMEDVMDTNMDFMIVQPTVESVMPTIGPVSGGSTVTIRGNNLDIGNKDMTRVLFRETPGGGTGRRRKRQSCPQQECDINLSSFNSTYFSCVSPEGGSPDCVMSVVVVFDGDEVDNDDVVFQYTPDPVFESVTPQDVIPAGGFYIGFSGTNLNVTQSPVIRITDNRFQSTEGDCTSLSGSLLRCLFPRLTPLTSIDSVYGSIVMYSVIVDSATGPNPTDTVLQLILRPNPIITEVITNEITLPLTGNEVIRIRGSNLTSDMRTYIFITVGEYNCTVRTVDATEVSCTVPTDINEDGDLYISVTIGFLSFGETSDPWKVSFVTVIDPERVNSAAIGGAVGGVAFVAVVIITVIVFVICVAARRASRRKDMRFVKLMNDMEKMEIEMAVTCKTAFAELQTDLGELVNEEALESQLLPFQSFPTYATKFFFPNANVNHPVLCPPRLPEKLSDEDFKALMTEFYGLILDKGFLCSFIKTLESQTKVTVHEKSTIASLLMVSCLKDIDYATEILNILLGDLIRTNLSQSRNHPKILLRRTESVAEKLLTNWFCVTLYPHLRDVVGPPLFVLFKAVKAQLEKGPIDVMTGEAKNSLSEEKLLRQSLDFKVLECEVDMANARYLLSRMKHLRDFEPDNSASDNDIQIIKLLDTDSISQTKEKMLDFLFRNRPVSQRPGINEVDLELCRGNAGISLRDQDTISKKDGEWTRINTLGHYDIPTMADAAIEDPKKQTPRFRLTYRGDRPRSGANFDYAGTIITSASVTSQSSLHNSTMLQSLESTNRLYHLVKPDIGDGESSKIVSEVFLTRLLSTKRILQPYVDDLFHAIFNIPRDKPFPLAIKTFFDFLDLQAAELSIADPEVLHIWKTNGLPLRFWVNLIKNPEFIFDINKSATIDACFTVIAQAYIDACSTSEVRYTRDTPSARLLYAKEVSNYKAEVLSYYDGIQSIPAISPDELKEHFRESLFPLFKEFENHDGCHFHSDSALLELYRYAVQYSEQICETLQEDRLTMLATQFNSLQQKYPFDSSPM